MALVLATVALFLPRGIDRYDNYDAAYSWVAFGFGLVPAAVALVMLVKLGRHRAVGTAPRALNVAAVVAVVVAVPAGWFGALMFGIH